MARRIRPQRTTAPQAPATASGSHPNSPPPLGGEAEERQLLGDPAPNDREAVGGAAAAAMPQRHPETRFWRGHLAAQLASAADGGFGGVHASCPEHKRNIANLEPQQPTSLASAKGLSRPASQIKRERPLEVGRSLEVMIVGCRRPCSQAAAFRSFRTWRRRPRRTSARSGRTGRSPRTGSCRYGSGYRRRRRYSAASR
jgi:hypothetical protein